MALFDFSLMESCQKMNIGQRVFVIALGTVLFAIGVLGLFLTVATDLASPTLFGWLLLSTGIINLVFSYASGCWPGFGIHFILGVVYSLGGSLIMAGDVSRTLTLNISLGLILLITGILRIMLATSIRFTSQNWALLSGIVSLGMSAFCLTILRNSSAMIIGAPLALDVLLLGAYLTSFGWKEQHLGESELPGNPPQTLPV